MTDVREEETKRPEENNSQTKRRWWQRHKPKSSKEIQTTTTTTTTHTHTHITQTQKLTRKTKQRVAEKKKERKEKNRQTTSNQPPRWQRRGHRYSDRCSSLSMRERLLSKFSTQTNQRQDGKKLNKKWPQRFKKTFAGIPSLTARGGTQQGLDVGQKKEKLRIWKKRQFCSFLFFYKNPVRPFKKKEEKMEKNRKQDFMRQVEMMETVNQSLCRGRRRRRWIKNSVDVQVLIISTTTIEREWEGLELIVFFIIYSSET